MAETTRTTMKAQPPESPPKVGEVWRFDTSDSVYVARDCVVTNVSNGLVRFKHGTVEPIENFRSGTEYGRWRRVKATPGSPYIPIWVAPPPAPPSTPKPAPPPVPRVGEWYRRGESCEHRVCSVEDGGVLLVAAAVIGERSKYDGCGLIFDVDGLDVAGWTRCPAPPAPSGIRVPDTTRTMYCENMEDL